MQRRTYLVGCAGVTAGLAGCGNLDNGSDDSGTGDDEDDDDEGSSTPAQVGTVQQFYRLLDQGEIAAANELVHPEASGLEIDEQDSERYRDEIDLSLVEAELLTVDDGETEVRVKQRLDSESYEEAQTSELVVVLRQYEGEWRIYGSRAYDPEETPMGDDEQTDDGTTDDTTASLQVVTAVGTDRDGDSRLESVSLLVKKAPGSADIDLSRVTIQYVTSNEVLDLTVEETGGESVFSTEAVQDDDDSLDDNVINDPEDRAVVQLTERRSNITPLEEGTRAEVKLVTQSGTETTVSLNVPESLGDKQTVSL